MPACVASVPRARLPNTRSNPWRCDAAALPRRKNGRGALPVPSGYAEFKESCPPHASAEYQRDHDAWFLRAHRALSRISKPYLNVSFEDSTQRAETVVQRAYSLAGQSTGQDDAKCP